MEQQLWPNHLGVWTIKVPDDMPIQQIAMLQATIAEAWASYGGDPENAEQFFNHLVGNGAADVPRETSAVRRPVQGETWRLITHPDDKVKVIFVGGMSDEYGPDPVTYRHINGCCRLPVHAAKNHQSVRPMPSFLGLYEPDDDDVPRETERYQVDVIYRVNGGEARSAQRTVEAVDWPSAREHACDVLTAAFPQDEVTFYHFSGGVVSDGGPVVVDVPRETSEGS